MGSSHSQHHQIPITQWTQSYPRLRHSQPQVKVLPERLPPLQLRTTDNGAILQNGGTISCRKQNANPQEERIYRPRSSSAHRPPKPENINLEKTRYGSEPDLRFHLKESSDQFSDNAVRQRISRSRKKYKAPPAPRNGMANGVESSSPDLNGWEASGRDCTGGPCRRGRLFKTRAESSKKNVTSLRTQSKEESELSRSTEALNVIKPKFKEDKFHQNSGRMEKKGLKRSASQEVISTRKGLATPEFQAEIVEVAQRLRSSGMRESSQSNAQVKSEVFRSLKIEIPKENDLELNKKMMKIYDSEETGKRCQGNEPRSGRTDEQKEKSERDVPFKKFYFGMKESDNEIKIVNNSTSTNNVDKTNAEHRLTAVEKSKNLMNLYKSVAEAGPEWEDTADKFAANFHKAQMSMPNGNTTSCSSSFVSDPDEEVDGGIALQLRPTLPKKTLEIPRFSPTAAWRLLSSIDTFGSQAPSPGGSEEGPLLLEDRIHPPAPQNGLRSSHDKSGDSGISGDASPGGCHESSSEIAAASPKPATTQNSKNILVAWTPQQDLEEESSSDDLELPLNSSKSAVCKIPGARFSSRGQLFVSRDPSFSVPATREESTSLYTENGDFKERMSTDLTPRLNSLKKLKVGLSSGKQYDVPDERNHSPNDNWVLSRSVPSSLNNSHVAATRSISDPSSPEQDDECAQQTSLNYPSYSYLANGGRIMYLPEYHSRMSPDVSEKKTRSNACYGFLSKSCENITQPEMQQVRRSRSPSPMGTGNREDTRSRLDVCKPNQKKKKFTFQSTVRLLENRRIAERLSREAELKENQRLSELEAMKKVEEEFQKKRAREKANIRHQLRLFSLEEKNCSSLPPFDWEENRGDSTGAPSSLPQVVQDLSSRKLSVKKITSAVDLSKFTPTTQVLSEFREPTRDYKDYRHSRFHEPQEFVAENSKRSVVEHPRVVYDMPKNTAVYVSAPVNPFAQNQFKDEPASSKMGLSTPRLSSSDNYRKDFAHGALPNSGRSLTSSDSELSQSHPRSSSRQGLPPRGFTAQHRSRSASPQSLTPASSPRGFDCVGNIPRSRSVSPVKIAISPKSRSTDGNGGKDTERLNDSPVLEQKLVQETKSLERKMSDPNDYQSKVFQVLNFDGAPGKNVFNFSLSTRCDEKELRERVAADSLLRLGLPSLQPFNKSEKSFRPINFNPVINKLAQIVT